MNSPHPPCSLQHLADTIGAAVTVEEIRRNIFAILDDEKASISADCRLFPQWGLVRIVVPIANYRAWRAGAHIQDAFADLHPRWREVLMSGTTPAEWIEMAEGREIDADEAATLATGSGIYFGTYIFDVD